MVIIFGFNDSLSGVNTLEYFCILLCRGQDYPDISTRDPVYTFLSIFWENVLRVKNPLWREIIVTLEDSESLPDRSVASTDEVLHTPHPSILLFLLSFYVSMSVELHFIIVVFSQRKL